MAELEVRNLSKRFGKTLAVDDAFHPSRSGRNHLRVVLILDEPANGLDPQGMRWLREQAASGRTVLVSSHLLSEVAQTAEQLVVIRDGRLVAEASFDEFTTGPASQMRVRASDPEGLATALRGKGASIDRDGDGALLVRGVNGEEIGDLALAGGVAIYELAPLRSSLEERFLEVTGEEAVGETAARRGAEAAHRPHHLDDARHRIARRGPLCRAHVGLVSLADVGPIESREGSLPAPGDIVSVYAGVVASFALLGAFGLGVGAIVRNQVGAIIAAFGFFFVLSSLPELLPGEIGDYFPAQAVGSLHGLPDEGLSQVTGGLVLAGWSLALVLVGTLLIRHRDLNE
jgi:hypothetical protein